MRRSYIYSIFLASLLVSVGLSSTVFAQKKLTSGSSSVKDDYNLRMERTDRIRQNQQFNEKEDRFYALKEEHERKKGRLKRLRSEVVRRYKALRSIQDELAATINRQEAEEAEEETDPAAEGTGESRVQEIRRLAKTYEAMKANQAASVIEVLVSDNKLQLAVDVMKVIKPRKSGKILGALKPEIAAKVSERMSGRRARKSRSKSRRAK